MGRPGGHRRRRRTGGRRVTPPVRLHVGDAAAAWLAAAAARTVPGVVDLRPDLAQALVGVAGAVLGSDRVRAFATAGVTAAVTGGTVEVAVTVVTRIGANCRDVAEAVQRAVAAELAAQAGLAARVTVTVADVLIG